MQHPAAYLRDKIIILDILELFGMVNFSNSTTQACKVTTHR